MMLYYSKTRKIKYFLDPPHKKKTNDRDYIYTHKCWSLPPGCDLDIH